MESSQIEIYDQIRSRIHSVRSEMRGFYWLRDEVIDLLEQLDEIEHRGEIYDQLDVIEVAYAVMRSEGRSTLNDSEVGQMKSALDRLIVLIDDESKWTE